MNNYDTYRCIRNYSRFYKGGEYMGFYDHFEDIADE